MRLVDVDEFKQDFNMGNDCESCVMDRKSCEYDRVYSKMDFCGWLDDAVDYKPKKGKWIKAYWHGNTIRECSTCHVTQTVNIFKGKVMFKYCPYCGASMEGDSDERSM